jgi:hypothetical protein
MEQTLNRAFPPPLTHPEHFYCFIGVAISWQCAFLLIVRDPQRFRLFMLPAVLEKLSFGVTTLVLYALGRVAVLVACAGSNELVFAVLFVLAFHSSRSVEDCKHHPTSEFLAQVTLR